MSIWVKERCLTFQTKWLSLFHAPADDLPAFLGQTRLAGCLFPNHLGFVINERVVGHVRSLGHFTGVVLAFANNSVAQIQWWLWSIILFVSYGQDGATLRCTRPLLPGTGLSAHQRLTPLT